MKLKDLKPGTFFEFLQPGYCFGRCLWLGSDGFEQLSFVHRSASGMRFVHNDILQDVDPEVTVEVPQAWDGKLQESCDACGGDNKFACNCFD